MFWTPLRTLVALGLALLWIQAVLAAPSSAKSNSTLSAEQKLKQIQALARSAKGNVIHLDDSTFQYYGASAPLPYSLIVFLTASHPKFRCASCKSIDRELQLLATSFKDTPQDPEKPPVFFVRLDYESSQRVFQSFGAQSVPIIFHSPPKLSDKERTEAGIPVREKFAVPADPTAESMANFLRERTGYNVTIKRSMIGVYISMIVIFSLMALAVRPIINSLPFWIKVIQWKPLWILASAGVYTCAISGMIFDIIRNPPFYHVSHTGQLMLFNPQSGFQFVAEGFIIGFLNLACGGALFLLLYSPSFSKPNHRTNGILASIFIFSICFLMIRNLYRMKNRWYGIAM